MRDYVDAQTEEAGEYLLELQMRLKGSGARMYSAVLAGGSIGAECGVVDRDYLFTKHEGVYVSGLVKSVLRGLRSMNEGRTTAGSRECGRELDRAAVEVKVRERETGAQETRPTGRTQETRHRDNPRSKRRRA